LLLGNWVAWVAHLVHKFWRRLGQPDAGHAVFTPTHIGVGKRFHQSAENMRP
jgi:hypothetical protein